MSEVYIRSQNKEKLYVLSIAFNALQYEEIKDCKKGKEGTVRHTICIADGCLEEVAEYESKERCIEVLDEVQALCGSYAYAPGNPGYLRGSVAVPPVVAMIPRVYQMPEK